VVLDAGAPVCQGPKEPLLSRLPHPHLRELWEAVPRLAVSP
jgi:ABC-type glutathione transport system ATPase component